MNKNTHIISELNTFFHKNDCNKAINCIMTTIRHFNLRSSCIGVEKRHNCKLSCLQVLELLLVFPFFMVKNSFQYHHSGLSKFFSCQKDMFYRFMEQDNIDWRKLVYLVSIRLLNRISFEEGLERIPPMSDNRRYRPAENRFQDGNDRPHLFTRSSQERLGFQRSVPVPYGREDTDLAWLLASRGGRQEPWKEARIDRQAAESTLQQETWRGFRSQHPYKGIQTKQDRPFHWNGQRIHQERHTLWLSAGWQLVYLCRLVEFHLLKTSEMPSDRHD